MSVERANGTAHSARSQPCLIFEIAADIANIAEGDIPANFEEVKDFLRRIPSSL
jgi:hypothetical protein